MILASLDLLKKRYSIQKWGIDLPHLLLHCATCVQNKTRSNGQSRYIIIFKSLNVLFSLVYMHILFSKSSIPTWYIRTIMQCMLQCMHYPKVIHVLLYKTLLNFWCVPAPNPQVPDIIFFVIRIYIPLYSIIHIHNNTLLGPPT